LLSGIDTVASLYNILIIAIVKRLTIQMIRGANFVPLFVEGSFSSTAGDQLSLKSILLLLSLKKISS